MTGLIIHGLGCLIEAPAYIQATDLVQYYAEKFRYWSVIIVNRPRVSQAQF